MYRDKIDPGQTIEGGVGYLTVAIWTASIAGWHVASRGLKGAKGRQAATWLGRLKMMGCKDTEHRHDAHGKGC